MKDEKQQWMTLPEVMEFLGVTDRQVHRLVAEGKLERRRERGPRDPHPTSYYSRASVEAHKDRKPMAVPVVSPAVSNDPAVTELTRHGQFDGLQRLIAAIAAAVQQQRNDADPPAWMSARQAAEYTSLPASYIRHLMRSGALPVLNVGTVKNPKFRVARVVLDDVLPGLSAAWHG